MDERLPGQIRRFIDAHPEIYEAFQELGRRVHEEGPLSEQERRLVKIGVAVGAGTEGGVHSAVRRALAAGVSREAIEHAVRLAITTIGWPNAMAAITWAQDILDAEAPRALA